MASRPDTFDLGALQLRSGEGRRIDFPVTIEPLRLGGAAYTVAPAEIPTRLDISRMTGNGYALRLRFSAEVHGTCMRCLGDAAPRFDIDSREIAQPGGGPELESPYVVAEVLDVGAWARDALVLEMPAQVLCTPDCAGLCSEGGEPRAELPAAHAPERPVDPRWAKLGELNFD